MPLSTSRFDDLLAAFRSPAPTPGGGSAAALAGAVGAALLAMVATLPKPRLRSDREGQQLADAAARCAALSDRLAALMDRDSDAYALVVAAFRLPKATGEDKERRMAQIQVALRAATEAPLDVMRACLEGLRDASLVAGFGNSNAASDVLVGLELLVAGLRGARANVEVNLASVRDESYLAATTAEAERLSADADAAVSGARRALTG